MEPIHIKIKFRSGFLIGSGFGIAGLLDNTTLKDDQGLPYIPGPSIKGVIRNACSELLSLVKGYKSYSTEIMEIKAVKSGNMDVMDRKNYTPVTQIFGTPLFPGLYRFDSAFLQSDINEDIRNIRERCTWQEGGNAINPSTRTALENHLFSHEVAMPTGCGSALSGYAFRFTITPSMDDIDENLTALLFCGIRFADRLGAKKSRGKGVVEFEPEMPYKGKTLEEWIGLQFNSTGDAS